MSLKPGQSSEGPDGRRQPGIDSSTHFQPAPGKKRFLFFLITLLLPLAVFVLLEVALQFFSYGGELDLVLKTRVGGVERYVINRSVAKRYFVHSGTVIPEPEDDSFDIKPGPDTKRIFCLGESTMAGFPYEFQATAPGFLADRAQTLLPNAHIEVINIGLSAVGSYVILDFMRELLPYHPDLFIIYSGHNEYYGIYGAASSVSRGSLPWLTSLSVRLTHFRTFLLLRNAVNTIRNTVSPPSGEARETDLMEQMVGEEVIPSGGQIYNAGLENFRSNLESMIDIAHRAGVPIVFSALVCNIEDQPPFKDPAPVGASDSTRRVLQLLVAEGDSLLKSNDPGMAISKFQKATQVLPGSALAAYKLGKALETSGRYSEALHELTRAKDLDGLRFRASTDVEKILRQVCTAHGVPVSPVDSVFASASPHGIPGGTLILEHLHPNLWGYYLMAKTWLKTIAGAGLLAGAQEWRWNAEPPDSQMFLRTPVTSFDSCVGEIRTKLLTHRWPFMDRDEAYRFVPANPVEQIAFDYVRGKLPWSDARYRMSEYWTSLKKFDEARRECEAIARILTESYQPLLRIADIFRMEGKTQDAVEAYVRCIQRQDNPYARIKLAIIRLEQEKPREASDQIQKSLQLIATDYTSFPHSALSPTYYLLGVAYAKDGNVDGARTELKKALAIDPGNNDARTLLNNLSSKLPPR